MTISNVNDHRYFRTQSDAELQGIKDNAELQQVHRSYAEAEMKRRQRWFFAKVTLAGAAIAATVGAIMPFIVDYIKGMRCG